jgi:uncharacterized alpha-E superfamily protein
MTSPQLHAVLDLLLSDESNPRSILYQLEALDGHLRAIPSAVEKVGLSASQHVVVRRMTDLRLADVQHLAAAQNKRGQLAELDRLLRGIDAEMESLSEFISNAYFSHAINQRAAGPRTGSEETPA